MTTTAQPTALFTTHADLVYAAALRQTRDPHRAADIAQAVLIVALRKTQQNQLPEDRFMTGWLLKITHYAVKESNRAAARRTRHETTAAKDRHELSPQPSAPIEGLDDALLSLPSLDREALIRRYLQDEPVAGVAAALGTTENTASKRIARALDKLRSLLQHRGISLPAATLAAILAAESLIKAPPALAAAAATTGKMPLLAHHIIRSLFMAKAKLITLAAAALLIPIGGIATIIVTNHPIQPPPPAAQTPPLITDQAANNSSEIPTSPPVPNSPHPKPSALTLRYQHIFNQMNEKIDGDHRIQRLDESAKSLPTIYKKAVTMQLIPEQIITTASCWNHIEEATREIAARHGLSTTLLDQAPPLPTSHMQLDGLLTIINQRMVIPIDDPMAQEIIDLVNTRYAAAHPATTQ